MHSEASMIQDEKDLDDILDAMDDRKPIHDRRVQVALGLAVLISLVAFYAWMTVPEMQDCTLDIQGVLLKGNCTWLAHIKDSKDIDWSKIDLENLSKEKQDQFRMSFGMEQKPIELKIAATTTATSTTIKPVICECPLCPTCPEPVTCKPDTLTPEIRKEALNYKLPEATPAVQLGAAECKKFYIKLLKLKNSSDNLLESHKYDKSINDAVCKLDTDYFWFKKFRYQGHDTINLSARVWDVRLNNSVYTLLYANDRAGKNINRPANASIDEYDWTGIV